MKRVRQYRPEFGLVAVAILISALGFWDLYFGAGANPQPHHHLHIVTAFIWLGLLLAQLNLIARGSRMMHRRVGRAALVAAPLLVATTALLSVRSAHEGVVSGEGDLLIVQNVMATLELALFISLGFLLKKRRQLHGSLLLSTAILFMGIALFFASVSFVPQFRIEGPETFYRFEIAAYTGQGICLVVGLLFFIRDRRNGWPYLAAGSCFFLNEAVRSFLSSYGLIEPLTATVGAMSQPLTFVATFSLLFWLLASTALPRRGRISGTSAGNVSAA